MNISKKLMLCVGLMFASQGANASFNSHGVDARAEAEIGSEYILPVAVFGVSLSEGVFGRVEGFGFMGQAKISGPALLSAFLIGCGLCIACKKDTKKQEPKADDQDSVEQAKQA
ncbi:MAG: hypothetical protein NTZ68_02030 [Candidatus Dependentiae bacterium]|nr:hypothetical protein [Candidatus Dependentiae bacterium]